MKWSNRIAQGFSPGLLSDNSALKVAPEETSFGIGAIDAYTRPKTSGATFRAPFIDHLTQG